MNRNPNKSERLGTVAAAPTGDHDICRSLRGFFSSTRQTTLCDPLDARGKVAAVALEAATATATIAPEEEQTQKRAKIQAEIDRLQHKSESCASCLWTGVGTCVGLAAYFAHAAYEIDESKLTAIAKRQQRYSKPAFLFISVGWLGIGAYRWYLG